MARTIIGIALLLSLYGYTTIPTTWIDTNDSPHVASVTGYTELTKSISILV